MLKKKQSDYNDIHMHCTLRRNCLMRSSSKLLAVTKKLRCNDKHSKKATTTHKDMRGVTDGMGTPDPNPRNLVNWCV